MAVMSANDLVNSYFNQSPRPVVYSSGENYSIKVPKQNVDIFGAFWYKDIKEWNTEGETNFIIMEKGKSYVIHIILVADENYFFANPVKLTINGKVMTSTEAEVNHATSDIMLVNYSVEAAEDGFNVVSGNNQTWTKGLTTPLSFTFKRAVGDSLTFNWFYGIRIDNDDTILRKDEHPEIFSCDSGSVIIDLEPKYLEKLSVGDHTLTAVLREPEVDEKYMMASASFTIAEKTSNDTSSSDTSTPVYRLPKTGIE